MSIYKWMAAFAMLALGAAVVLGLPALSPDVEAGLSASAVKADRLATPEPAKPEPVKLEQTRPEPISPQVQPQQVQPEPVKPEQVQPKKAKREKGKAQQAKGQQAKPQQGEPRPTAKAKGCSDSTLSYYEVKCQRTRTRIVNGVRTTRILPADPPSQQ